MHNYHSPFTGTIDLAGTLAGGTVLSCSDDFFAEKENLIKPTSPIFIEDRYTENGKWMDGWESRRRRSPGFDWSIIKLGLPACIKGVDIDTSHFRGNHPPYGSVEACVSPDNNLDATTKWDTILPQVPLKANDHNIFQIENENSNNSEYTHVRLNIFPDGGVARFRVYGKKERYSQEDLNGAIDLIGFQNGGEVLACSDSFFSPMQNLILPYEPLNMSQGWETRRNRHSDQDWVIIKACTPGIPKTIEISTKFFKGNFPDSLSIDYCCEKNTHLDELIHSNKIWRSLLDRQKMQADHHHVFTLAPNEQNKFTFLKLNIFPDGGIARLRVHGIPVK